MTQDHYNFITDEQLKRFMLESNAIEGENGLNPKDIEVARKAITLGFNSLSDVLSAHRLLTRHLHVEWGGKWREVNVRVGAWTAPDTTEIPHLMSMFEEQMERFTSYKAHNVFEKIHPFQDFNGRIGRLIWLSKAIKEGYDFSIPFLQKYYYQTLKSLSTNS